MFFQTALNTIERKLCKYTTIIHAEFMDKIQSIYKINLISSKICHGMNHLRKLGIWGDYQQSDVENIGLRITILLILIERQRTKYEIYSQ